MKLGPNLVLIGYRATGKTSVARQLARLLPHHTSLGTLVPPVWVDTDAEIERCCKKSIAQIFREDGESFFRDRETDVLRTLCARRTGIIATGGGAPMRSENQALLRLAGTIIWLTASAETIAHRINADPNSVSRRPLLRVETEYAERREPEKTTNEPIDTIRFVLRQREPIYRELADWTISSEEMSSEAIAQFIVTALERQLKNGDSPMAR